MVLAPMLSMCPNGKHPCKKLIPVHPESIASSAFKGKKIYDRRVRSSALKAHDTPDNAIYMRQIDSSPTGHVSQCAMQRPLYSCTGGTLVNKWSVIQPAAVSYSRHDAVAVLECKPSHALHVSRRSAIPATLLLTSTSATPDTRH